MLNQFLPSSPAFYQPPLCTPGDLTSFILLSCNFLLMGAYNMYPFTSGLFHHLMSETFIPVAACAGDSFTLAAVVFLVWKTIIGLCILLFIGPDIGGLWARNCQSWGGGQRVRQHPFPYSGCWVPSRCSSTNPVLVSHSLFRSWFVQKLREVVTVSRRILPEKGSESEGFLFL